MAEDDGCIQLADGQRITVQRGTPKEREFEVVCKLGEGGFSAVYKVKDPADDGLYAMKTESKADTSQRLKMEVQFLKELTDSGGKHFCRIAGAGRTQTYNYVIMTLCGKSIADIRRNLLPPYKFSLHSSIMIALQTLQGLEEMHNIGYLHRDVKPANFAIGRSEVGEQRHIYVLDFGLCRKYRSKDGSLHTPRASANFRGTTRYAPLACFYQKELARKDDIESWMYMMVEMTAGTLPWRSLVTKPDVRDSKEHSRTAAGKQVLFAGCPRQFSDILDFCDMLTYINQPDYQWIYSKLRSPLIKNKPPLAESDPLDWEVPERMAPIHEQD